MFCFWSILQIWIILIGFRDTNDFVNLGICKHEFKFTYRDYCRVTLKKWKSVSQDLLIWDWNFRKGNRETFQKMYTLYPLWGIVVKLGHFLLKDVATPQNGTFSPPHRKIIRSLNVNASTFQRRSWRNFKTLLHRTLVTFPGHILCEGKPRVSPWSARLKLQNSLFNFCPWALIMLLQLYSTNKISVSEAKS